MRYELQHSGWIADLHPSRWLWLLLIALPVIALIAFVAYQTTQVLPRIALVPGYMSLDQQGEQLTNEMMRGKLVIYAFTEADCQAPCLDPTLLLHQLQQDVSRAQTDDIPLHFVISSGDFETPATLSARAQQIGVEGEQWHFVSSERDRFSTVLQVAGQENGGTIDSEPLLILADGWGIVRAIYSTPDLARLRHDLRLVAQEARNSTGVNRFAYETVHLFMCHSDLNATTYSQP